MSNPTKTTLVTAALVALLGITTTAGASLRTDALETYFDRCDIDPEGAGAERAYNDYELLVDMGYRPSEILTLVQEFPRECTYISFKAAVMGEKRKQDQRAKGTFQPSDDDGDSAAEIRARVRRQRRERLLDGADIDGLDPDDLITSTEWGYRGLPQGLHDDYRFGLFCAAYTAVNLVLGVTFTALYQANDDVIAFGAAGTAWALSIMWGTWAAIMGIKVEVNRDTTARVYREYEGRQFTPPRFSVGPGGITVRF